MRRYVAWAVVAGWLVLVGLTSSAAGDLTAAQDNSSAAYLPSDA